MNVIKRDGREVQFDKNRIINAITKASDDTSKTNEKLALSNDEILKIANRLSNRYRKRNYPSGVEDIQDDVETELMKNGYYEIARNYIKYRRSKEIIRKSNTTDAAILSLISLENEEIKQENSNKNPTINSVQRDYMAGEVSKDLTKRFLLPKEITDAHEKGLIHFHDSDYFAQHMHNCCLVNLDDMLQNGTVISETMIEKPHSFSTACTVATQIIAQVASSQYGGQSISLAHLAPFVDISRQKIKQEVINEYALLASSISLEDEKCYELNAMIDDITELRLKKEITKGIQTIQYQTITLQTTNGQAPFITVFMYLNEAKNQREKEDLALLIGEVLNQRIQGVKNEKGVWITPAFPKLIYVLEDDNISEDSQYWYLTELAAECTAKRMVPDYISEKVMLENKIDKNGNGNCYTCMGCRSFLTPYVDNKNVPKYYGRFNQGVVTVNLVDIALTAKKRRLKEITYVDEVQYENALFDIFDDVFAERMELCHKALRCRHERLKGTVSDVAPILWQHGALTRLNKGDTIDEYLYGGYSTISLGYAGLWECVYALTGSKLTEPIGKDIGLKIMDKLNSYTNRWKQEENIDYSIYGTPLESTTYKFAKCLQKRFGVIEGVTDRNYITNSYHIHVSENIDAFKKLAIESEFQKLSPGGAISYIEVPNMQNNIPAVLQVMKFIYENIMYAELNTKSDFCQCCGYNGEIKIVEDKNNKLIWQCPNCGNIDQNKMNVARRTCGYIGTQFWNQGRTQEIKERVLHL